MTALCAPSFIQRLGPQYTDELGEFHAVVASFKAHKTIKARPDGLILIISVPVFHIPLDDKPRIEIGVVTGNRTDHSALAAVET